MHLPDPPLVCAGKLDDAALLSLFETWGRCSQVAMRRALALLPEIVRRGQHRRVVTPGEVVRRLLMEHRRPRVPRAAAIIRTTSEPAAVSITG